jgi:hypothetical protein
MKIWKLFRTVSDAVIKSPDRKSFAATIVPGSLRLSTRFSCLGFATTSDGGFHNLREPKPPEDWSFRTLQA